MKNKRLPVTVEIHWEEPTPERVARANAFWARVDERIRRQKDEESKRPQSNQRQTL